MVYVTSNFVHKVILLSCIFKVCLDPNSHKMWRRSATLPRHDILDSGWSVSSSYGGQEQTEFGPLVEANVYRWSQNQYMLG